MNTNQAGNISLPIKHRLTYTYVLSLIIALLMAVSASVGFLYPATTYPTIPLRQSFMPNDVVNLFIGVPILLGSMWLARRGRLIGLLFWPGALFYALYNYIAYIFALPLNPGFVINLALVILCVYTLIGLIANIDSAIVQQRLAGTVPERAGGGVLIVFGLLFTIRVLSVLAGALVNQTPVTDIELAVLVADFMTSPALMIGGVLLWRRGAFGYVIGIGLLFQTSMLFVGLLAFMFLQPFLTSAPFVLVDVIVVFVMGLVCSIPFARFVRGVISKRSA